MLKIDLHIHTIASGHANCTLVEFIEQARKNKMKVIGLADHGPGNKETTVTEIYFTELRRIPKSVNGVRILKGIEANVIDGGGIDISDGAIAKMDYVMAGWHKNAGFTDKGEKANTATLIKLIKSGKIDIITHPFITSYALDLEAVARAACQNNVLLEANSSYLTNLRGPEKYQRNVDNLKKVVKIVKELKQKIIVGSDAHNIWELGDDAPVRKIKKQIGLTDELIINNYPGELFKILGIK